MPRAGRFILGRQAAAARGATFSFPCREQRRCRHFTMTAVLPLRAADYATAKKSFAFCRQCAPLRYDARCHTCALSKRLRAETASTSAEDTATW